MKYEPATIELVLKAIKKAGSNDIDEVCQTLENIVIERLRYMTLCADGMELADGMSTRLCKMGLKTTRDVRNIILQVERVRA